MTTMQLSYDGMAELVSDDGRSLGTVRVNLHKTPPMGARLGHWEGTLVPDHAAQDAPTTLAPGQVTLRLATGRSGFAVLKRVSRSSDRAQHVDLVGSGPPPF